MNDIINEQLHEYVRGTLANTEREALERELATSGELRKELDHVRAYYRTLSSLPKMTIGDDFLNAINKQIDAPSFA